MSAYYGQVEGFSETVASRRGSEKSGLRVSCQSYDGSIIVSTAGKGVFRIFVSDDSSFYGERVFEGTIEQLKAVLTGAAVYEEENKWDKEIGDVV